MVKDGRFLPTIGDESPTAYVRGKLDPKIRSYSVYRKNKELRSPDNPDVVIGSELIYVGVFVITELGADYTHRGRLIDAKQHLAKGDRLYPGGTSERTALSFEPQAPPPGIRANIISVLDGEIAVGENNVIAIDVGEEDGIRPGMVLPLYGRSVEFSDRVSAALRAKQEAAVPIRFDGEDDNFITGLFSATFNRVRDMKNRVDATPLVDYLGAPQQAPDQVRVWPELNGNIIVFRTFEEVSYALVVELSRVAFRDDLILSSDALLRESANR